MSRPLRLRSGEPCRRALHGDGQATSAQPSVSRPFRRPREFLGETPTRANTKTPDPSGGERSACRIRVEFGTLVLIFLGEDEGADTDADTEEPSLEIEGSKHERARTSRTKRTVRWMASSGRGAQRA